MKKKIEMSLHFVVFGFLLNSAQAQTQKPIQLQTLQQVRMPFSPQTQARINLSGLYAHGAAVSLHNGNYTAAVADAEKALSLDAMNGIAEEVIAESLDAQHKDQEALQAYHIMVVDEKATYLRVLLPYSLLLLKSGQWAQSVAVYNQALPHLGTGKLEQESSHFSPDVPEPGALAVAIHLERGQLYNGTCNWARQSQNVEAMREYQAVLQLAPDSPLTNYYYGYGWQKLSPAERVQFGTAEQAKAALKKAIKLGKGDVKKAAEKALRGA